MAAIDTTPIDRADGATALAKAISAYKKVVITPALSAFAENGTATGQAVHGLSVRSAEFVEEATALVLSQTREQLRASWALVVGTEVPNFRNDLVALGAAVQGLLDLIDANGEWVLPTGVDSGTRRQVFSALSSDSRALIRAELDQISALLT